MATLLYTRRGCHLCDEAEDLLATLGLVATRVDVDGDETVAARYGLRVPVLEIDGVVVMEGRFDGRRLAAALPPAHRPRGQARGPD
ncbi:MAG: glutaredoxin family protein [Pirellulales bacterium]